MTADVLVHVAVDGDDVLAGRAWSHRRRGTESATFAYADSYLTHPAAYALDPQLPLTSGSQQSQAGLPLFRAFADGSPDRWGRNLILRRERTLSRERGVAPRSFGEFDLLLGVRDDLRQGALRFRAQEGPFLADERTGVPLLTELPALLGAADRVGSDTADAADLAALVRAGSSLGGARPKAHVRDPESGALAIAKFPSPASDRWDVMRWEKTALDLARSAGIRVPDSQLVLVDGRAVLVVDRFDRVGGRRIGYASALTMLEARDGDLRSYLDIAAVVEERSDAVTRELHQLWRRIVFSVLVTNTDDHLRNHGFLHAGGGVWHLSPAFDINPEPESDRQLSTAIDESDTSASVDTVLSVAGLLRLRPDAALHALGEVSAACSTWADVARRNGLTSARVADMAPAFEHAEAERARALVAA